MRWSSVSGQGGGGEVWEASEQWFIELFLIILFMVSSNHRLIISFPVSSLMPLPIFDKNIITMEWLGLLTTTTLSCCFMVIPKTFLLYFKRLLLLVPCQGRCSSVQYLLLQKFYDSNKCVRFDLSFDFDSRNDVTFQCTTKKDRWLDLRGR